MPVSPRVQLSACLFRYLNARLQERWPLPPCSTRTRHTGALHPAHRRISVEMAYELVKRQNKFPPSHKTSCRCPVRSSTAEEWYYDTFCSALTQEKHSLYQSIMSPEGGGRQLLLSACQFELNRKVGLFIIRDSVRSR